MRQVRLLVADGRGQTNRGRTGGGTTTDEHRWTRIGRRMGTIARNGFGWPPFHLASRAPSPARSPRPPLAPPAPGTAPGSRSPASAAPRSPPPGDPHVGQDSNLVIPPSHVGRDSDLANMIIYTDEQIGILSHVAPIPQGRHLGALDVHDLLGERHPRDRLAHLHPPGTATPKSCHISHRPARRSRRREGAALPGRATDGCPHSPSFPASNPFTGIGSKLKLGPTPMPPLPR
jgi:hypothetical protein